MFLRKFDKILLILDVKFKTIMINIKFFLFSEKLKEITRILLKFWKSLENLKKIQRKFKENLKKI